MSGQHVVDLLSASLNAECIHLQTVRTCTFCKDKLFRRDYAKKYATKPQKAEPVDEPSKHYCDICRNKRPSSRNRANVRLPRTQHGVLEHHFGIPAQRKDGKIVRPAGKAFPWCNHDKGYCVCAQPPTMAGPTVEMPKLHKATHSLPDGRWVCDECCDGHCKRCHDSLPDGKRGTSLGVRPQGQRRRTSLAEDVPIPSVWG